MGGSGGVIYGDNRFDNLERQGTLGNYKGSDVYTPPTNDVGGQDGVIRSGSFSDLPPNAREAYKAYDASGWKGNYSGQAPGTSAGGSYRNRDGMLPKTDESGAAITYREFDINAPKVGIGRDAERFVIGSDGSIYFTDSHYGDSVSPSGLPPFLKIK